MYFGAILDTSDFWIKRSKVSHRKQLHAGRGTQYSTGRVRPSSYNYHTTVQFMFSNNEMQYSNTSHRSNGTKAFEKLAPAKNTMVFNICSHKQMNITR